ncbi:3-phytase [Actinomadura luteofluorescens]|uniref:3-phytase n=2 Tax=Actinomadura luteofluorescens TaxID=46163 RepID=A0A7Y9EBL0_9ACTN|nr:phytase [Actinomadura luteofluorescens]NYD44461.1 3-phytase [Actinomadura luteofluorescens]
MQLRPTPQGARLAAAATTAALAAAFLSAVPAAADGDELAQVRAALETPANLDDDAGGNANADDPAIWSHPDDRDGDLIVATLKQGGLAVYDAAGRQIQRLAAPTPPRPGDEPGRFNNVDLIYGFQLGRRKVDLAVVSDRGRDTVRAYAIDPAKAEAHRAPLTDVTDPAAPPVFSSSLDEINEQATAYGLASWKDSRGTSYVALSRRHTSRIGTVRLEATAAGTITYRHVRDVDLPTSFALPGGGTWAPCEDPGEGPQVEGMVADPENGVLFAAQEDVGIWRIPLGGGSPQLVDKVREYGVPASYDPETEECAPSGPDPGAGGTHLTADAEGLSIYRQDDGEGYLLASSQGDDTFVVYDRQDPRRYLGHFRVAPGATVDGSEVCDGAMVTSAPVGGFGKGLLVVHDGVNTPVVTDGNGEVRENTNFKLVDWEDVADPLDLDVTPGDWDPRD